MSAASASGELPADVVAALSAELDAPLVVGGMYIAVPRQWLLALKARLRGSEEAAPSRASLTEWLNMESQESNHSQLLQLQRGTVRGGAGEAVDLAHARARARARVQPRVPLRSPAVCARARARAAPTLPPPPSSLICSRAAR